MKLSVIVAVHNQLPMNRVFADSLERSSDLAHELVVVDNASTDGSREFFASRGATVVANDGNYSYPHCQNQGIAAARGDVLAFLNNDLVLPPHWDARLLETMEANGLDVVTPCGIENAEDGDATRRLRRRWSWIKNPSLRLFGAGERSLLRMHRWMYGDWERFSEERYQRFRHRVKEGFVGCCVLQTRRALERLGPWDERVQAADFDLYIRSKKRSLDVGDVRPCHIALDVFVHHYIRLTMKKARPVWKDGANLVSLDEKWGRETAERYLRMRVLD